MLYIKYRCPQCNKVLQVKPSNAEIIVKCDECKTEFRALPDANILNKLYTPIKKPFVILILLAIAITIFIVGIFLPRSIQMFFVILLFPLSLIIALISEFIIKNIKLKTLGQAVSIVIFCTMFLLFMVNGLIVVQKTFQLWPEPYDETHPASILGTIEDNSVVRFPKNIEALKAADRTGRGIDFAYYEFMLRFRTDQKGLAHFRESLSQLYGYEEWKADLDLPPKALATYCLGNKARQKRTPQWYRALPEGVVWTADGAGVAYSPDGEPIRGKFHEINCVWVVLTDSDEIVVFMEGEGDYSLKDYGD